MSIIVFLLIASSLAFAFDHSAPIEDIVGLEQQLEELKAHSVLNKMKSELEELESSHLTTRATKVQGSKKRLCGKRLAVFIRSTCGQCEPGTDENLSIMCCYQPCDMHQIIGACCPSMLIK